METAQDLGGVIAVRRSLQGDRYRLFWEALFNGVNNGVEPTELTPSELSLYLVCVDVVREDTQAVLEGEE